MAPLAWAQAPTGNPGAGGSIGKRLIDVIGGNTYNPGTDKSSATQYMGLIISVILSLFAVIFVILFIYAGYNYMTAAGKQEKVKIATGTMQSAVIGLIISIGVYAIWQFIFYNLLSPK